MRPGRGGRFVAAGRGGVPHQAYRYGRAVPEGSCWTGRGAGSWRRVVAPDRGAGSWRRVVAVPGVVATHERVVFGGDWTEFGSKATFSTHWRVKGAAQRV